MTRSRFTRFNSRTPRGVRPPWARRVPEQLQVSIHAPREGCDDLLDDIRLELISFNSRTPRGVRLSSNQGEGTYVFVSIHAPREGCDGRKRKHARGGGRFNSRTPRGVRPNAEPIQSDLLCFNSRTPRGVRQCGAKLCIIGRINKRNLREGMWKGWEGIRFSF